MASRRQETARRGAVTVGAYLLALPASLLPERWRRGLRMRDDLPIAEMNVISGLAQCLGCLGLGILGYIAWTHAMYAAMDARYAELDTTGKMGKEDYAMLGYSSLSMNPLLPLIYVFTSPVGFMSALFMITGLVRVLHQAITREPGPDPVLGGLDWLLSSLGTRRRAQQREAGKAPGPDRVMAGKPALDYALRIDSCADYDFKPGNTVQVGQDYYRVLRVREMQTSGGMRILYDLEVMPAGVAVRGMRRYDPPAGTIRA